MLSIMAGYYPGNVCEYGIYFTIISILFMGYLLYIEYSLINKENHVNDKVINSNLQLLQRSIEATKTPEFTAWKNGPREPNDVYILAKRDDKV